MTCVGVGSCRAGTVPPMICGPLTVLPTQTLRTLSGELRPSPGLLRKAGWGCMLSPACYTYGRSDMSRIQVTAAAALAALFAVSTAWGQQPTQRVAGTIDKVEGKTLYIKSASGPVTLTLADNAVVVARVKASAADIKAGDYVASGGVPQPDGTQKAVELRIFPESMRGNGDGHRPGWPGAPNGTMTNGAVGQTVTSVDGPVLTVKFKDGAAEKKLIVGPNVPVSRLEVSDRSELKSGVAVAAAAATKQPDGTFTAARIDFGRGGVVP
jgi:hypothetical protein